MILFILLVCILSAILLLTIMDAIENKKIKKELPFISILLIIIGLFVYFIFSEPDTQPKYVPPVSSEQTKSDITEIKEDMKEIKKQIKKK